MSLTNTRNLTQEQYQDLLYRLLAQVEGKSESPYCDTNSAHIPSIGIGFNLTIEKVRNEVFKAMGITDATIQARLLSVINDKAIRNLPTERTRNNALQNALDEALGKSFAMTDAQMLSVFALESDTHTKTVKNSANIDYSQELVALVSAEYTGVYGPGLKAALNSGNRAEAWYQIRYESNGDQDHGKRRYIESTLFGLTSDTITSDDVFNAYRMLNLHRNKILQYEKNYSNLIDDAQKDIKVAQIDNLTVPTLEEALNPARDSLIAILQANYASLAGKDLSSYQSTSIYLDPNRSNAREQLNPDHAATLNARQKDASGNEIASNDILIGEDGTDTLEGGKGNDILVGGKGFDSYVWHSGDGTDIIIDEDRQGVIKISNDNSQELIVAGTFEEKAAGSGIWTQMMADGSVLTLTNKTSWRLLTADGSEIILGQDWQNGDFGIHINNFNTPASIGATIIGDLSPIDFDLNVSGIQTQVDDLGNIKTASNKPEANRADKLYDSTGSDRLQGLGGQDVLDAKRGGDDILEGGDDSDVLLGGAGDDRLYGNLEENLAKLLAAGQSGPGTGQRGDLLAGGQGTDQLYGSNGNDALAGGNGADTLVGGLGGDVLLGDDNFISAGTNWNVTQKHQSDGQGGLSHSFVVVGAVYQHLAQGGDDRIYGGAGADLVFAGFGNDTIDTGTDNDVVFGDAGNDVLQGQGGNDILVGDGYGDVPYGNDYIFGGDGNDWLYGTGGDDYLDGGEGDDVLFGDHNGGNINADGEDILNGGLGDDTLFGGGNDDYLSGNSGNDALSGEDGNDYLDGNEGDDALDGGEGADILDGGEGTNTLFGQDGNDTLFGGLGNDSLSGGNGDDSYIINGNLHTLIQDYIGNNRLLIASNTLTDNYALSADSQTGNVFITNADDSESQIVINKALFGSELTISSDDGNLDIASLREWVGTNFNSSVNFTVLTENGNVYGGNASDKLTGLAGNNSLWGGWWL
ncbi:MAG: hypothetical protein HOP23_14270 [Methylococcaceae bacterium]|nr:hypothetical protein [Methylococcaceae bacterium]